MCRGVVSRCCFNCRHIIPIRTIWGVGTTIRSIIAFIVIVGTPLLSVVSTHFIKIIGEITSQVASEMPDMENLSGISFGQLNLTPEFLATVSVVNIAVTSLIASWLVAVISEGKDKYTVKYALMIVPSAFVMYYAFNYLVGLVL